MDQILETCRAYNSSQTIFIRICLCEQKVAFTKKLAIGTNIRDRLCGRNVHTAVKSSSKIKITKNIRNHAIFTSKCHGELN